MKHIVNIASPQATKENAFGCNWDLIALARTWLCHHKHVDRRNVGQMVVQEATPGRGGDFGPPRHVSPNRGPADLDAEFEQLSWVYLSDRPGFDLPSARTLHPAV
jgi:hypothetical protein